MGAIKTYVYKYRLPQAHQTHLLLLFFINNMLKEGSPCPGQLHPPSHSTVKKRMLRLPSL